MKKESLSDLSRKSTPRDRNLAFIWSCKNEHLGISKVLLEAKADPYFCEETKNCLSYAAINGNTDMMEMLINPNVNLNIPDKNKKTPLLYACENGNSDVACLLLKSGAKIIEGQEKQYIKYICENNLVEVLRNLPYSTDLDMNMVLLFACKNGKEEFARVAIEHKANIELKLEDKSFLVHACINENFGIADILFGNIFYYDSYFTDLYQLYNISSRVNSYVINTIIYKNTCRMSNVSYLRIDDEKRYKRIVERLFSENKHKDEDILFAVKLEDVGMMKILLELGTNPDIQGENDETPLINAVEKDNRYMVKILLDAGANPNIKDKFGSTALIKGVDAYKINEDILKLLLDANANPYIRNYDGTPLDIAIKNGDICTVEFLLNYGVEDREGRDTLRAARSRDKKKRKKEECRRYARGYNSDLRSYYRYEHNGYESDIGCSMSEGCGDTSDYSDSSDD